MSEPSRSDERRPGETIVDGIFETLRDRILDGTLPPGTRLRIRDLAAEFGASTMPIRESLNRLATIGLATQIPHRGAAVADLSLTDLHDFYGVRSVIEPPTARLGVTAIDAAGLVELRETIDALADAVRREDIREVLRLDMAFLRRLYVAVGNQALIEVIESMWARVMPYKMLYTTTAVEGAAEGILADDAAILAACERRAAADVERLLASGLTHARDRLTELLQRRR